MRDTILPTVVKAGERGRAQSFRVWSAASSSGEEPYSIAIQLHDFFSRQPGWDWKIDATDISTRILEKARAAIYPEDRLKEVPSEWMRPCFQKGTGEWEGHYRVRTAVREKVEFHHLNLLQPTYPFNQLFNVIWCRNVMIYFDRETQEQLVNKLAERLVPGGWLLIGHSESLTGLKHPLKAIKPAIYQKPA